MSTHLVGGSITYKFLQFNPGSSTFRYDITITTYQDIGSQFWNPQGPGQPAGLGGGFPENDISIGIYEGPAFAQSGTLPRVDSLDVPFFTWSLVSPTDYSVCGNPPLPSLAEVVYRQTVDLPFSTLGFHIIYDRCCRNSPMVNLNNAGQQGLSYYAYVGPTALQNSSPDFTEVPIPVICINNDTVTVLNNAVDNIDANDTLIFQFARPFRGNQTFTDPGSDYPNPVNWPLPGVNYNAGFTESQIFGPTGFQDINALSGFTRYKPVAQGFHVTAIDVYEFRNGVVAGIIRRDMQILAVNCPSFDSPFLSPGTNTTLTVEEGATVNFNALFLDSNAGDSVTVTAQSLTLDAAVTNPVATSNSGISGLTQANFNYAWNTNCDDGAPGSGAQYLVTVTAIDQVNCKTDIEFTINVTDFETPTNLIGPTSVCEGDTASYSFVPITGQTYNFSADSGTVLSFANNTGEVVWGPGPNAAAILNVTSANSCIDSFLQPVNISIVPANAGSDQSFCPGDSLTLGGSPTAFPGFTVNWGGNNLTNPTDFNPIATPTGNTSYVVTVTSAIGCTATDTVEAVVNGVPNADAGPDQTICLNFNAQLNAVGGVSYAWQADPTLSATNIPNPVATPTSTTTYFVTISDPNAPCVAVDSIIVSVIPSVTAAAGSDITICSNDSATIGGNPTGPTGFSVLWSPSAGLSNDTLSNPIAQPTATTTYVVSVSDSNGCADTDSITISINQAPVADAGNPISICFDDSAQLNANGGITYAWSNGSFLDNPNSQSPNAFPDSTTLFTVTVTAANSCTETDTVSAFVVQPTLSVGPDLFLCPGDSATLTATGGTNIIWTPNVALNTNLGAIVKTGTAVTMGYRAQGDSINGCPNFDSIMVFSGPTIPTDAGPDTAICVGDSIAVGGSPTSPQSQLPTTFSWTPVAGLSATNISNPTASPTATTDYIIETSNSGTCSGRDTIRITVNDLPTGFAGNDTIVCGGDSVQLNASGGITYAWAASTSLSDTTIANPIARPNGSATYVVTVTNANGCTDSDDILVSIANPPSVTLGSSEDSICPGSSFTLTANLGFSNYQWGPANLITAQGNATTTATLQNDQLFRVTVTNSGGCTGTDSIEIFAKVKPNLSVTQNGVFCADGDSVTLRANGAASYTWFPNQFITNVNIDTPSVFPTGPFQYTLFGTSLNGCFDSIVVPVTISNGPPLNITAQQNPICAGDSTQLLVTGGAGVYNWSPANIYSNSTIANPRAAPQTTSFLSVRSESVTTCPSRDSILINVRSAPPAVGGPDTSICFGDSVQLFATGGINYSWSPTGTMNNALTQTPTVFPTQNTAYVVTVTDGNACRGFDTVNVNIFQISPLQDTLICLGDSVQLYATPLFGEAGYTYSWSPTTFFDTNSPIDRPIAFPPSPITYFVTVTDARGCVDSASFSVGQLDTSVARMAYELRPACDSVQVQFFNQSLNTVRTLWVFNETDSSELADPLYTYPYQSQFMAKLIAFTDDGCPNTSDTLQTLLSFSDYFSDQNIGNVFTPNGDGINDYFEIDFDFKLQACTDLHVYNRWGQLVFSSQGRHHSWNGRLSNDKEASAGVYYFVLSLNGQDYNGNVTLRR